MSVKLVFSVNNQKAWQYGLILRKTKPYLYLHIYQKLLILLDDIYS